MWDYLDHPVCSEGKPRARVAPGFEVSMFTARPGLRFLPTTGRTLSAVLFWGALFGGCASTLPVTYQAAVPARSAVSALPASSGSSAAPRQVIAAPPPATQVAQGKPGPAFTPSDSPLLAAVKRGPQGKSSPREPDLWPSYRRSRPRLNVDVVYTPYYAYGYPYCGPGYGAACYGYGFGGPYAYGYWGARPYAYGFGARSWHHHSHGHVRAGGAIVHPRRLR